MGLGFRSVLVALIAAVAMTACTATIAENEAAASQQGAALASDPCPVFTATNAAHVSAGRATTQTRRIFIFTVTTYLALGTNESLGTSGSTTTTLYRIAPGRISRSASNCPDGGTAGSGGSGGSGGAAGSAAGGTGGVSAGSGGSGGGGGPGCGLAPPSAGAKQIAVNGATRSYELWLPAGYDRNRAYPLVLAFHGAGGNGRTAQAYFGVQQAAGSNAIVVYPDGLSRNGTTSWGLFGADATTDFAFFDALVASLRGSLCIDGERIFATGHSYGGYFSNTLGCARGNALRAIAPVAGGGPYVSCDGGQVAAWLEASTDDPVVAYSNGQTSRDRWLSANHCASTTHAVGPSACVEYDGCDPGYPVRWCSETSLGHGWPSYAGQAIWSFFSGL
jgi:poly(3-hydroxybutyrate) depolymerase